MIALRTQCNAYLPPHILRATRLGMQKDRQFFFAASMLQPFWADSLVSEISWHQCRDADFGSWLWCTFLKETFSMYYHFSPSCVRECRVIAMDLPNTCGVFAWLYFFWFDFCNILSALTGPFAVGSLVYLLGQTTRKRTTTYGFKGRRHICRGNLACTQVTVWLERGGKSTRTFFVQSPGNLFAD